MGLNLFSMTLQHVIKIFKRNRTLKFKIQFKTSRDIRSKFKQMRVDKYIHFLSVISLSPVLNRIYQYGGFNLNTQKICRIKVKYLRVHNLSSGCDNVPICNICSVSILLDLSTLCPSHKFFFIRQKSL